ncbi:MAG: cell wall hydrolase [Clostridia bacterium]|nr:cell wall hydrolase [Clostridia bacterium]
MRKTHKRLVSILLVVMLVAFNFSSVFAAGTTSYPLLKYGSRGTSVVRLQNALINKGYLRGPADGIYGRYTEGAVIKFQTAKRIRIDGIAGNQTQSLLYAATQTVSRSTSTTAATDLYWLSRIINAEAGAEPYNGKVAVGNVVLNRVRSSSFPNTIKGVIFEYYKGIPQFSPVADGSIYKTPSADSIRAAKDALNGVRPVGSATYFFNPDKASGSWIVANKTYVMRIGDHVFYK